MQKWEYLILDCEYYAGRWRPKAADGQEIANWRKLTVMQVIAQFGDVGWEMVGFSHNPEYEFWVFKRPKH